MQINKKLKIWLKPISTLLILLLFILILPDDPIDPWKLLSLKKIFTMIFALISVQTLGAILVHYLGLRAGSILLGFMSGLISSTAATAALAKKSRENLDKNSNVEILTFLSATMAMLFEGMSLLFVGSNKIHYSLFLIFVGPLTATGVMIFLRSQKLASQSIKLELTEFQFFPILKLTSFILLVLYISKLLQLFLGESGLFVITFLVSLFEIHGSIIANVQMQYLGAFNVFFLGNLLITSIIASYVSKLFLIRTLGSSELTTKAWKSTLVVLVSLLLSWILFWIFFKIGEGIS